MSKIETAFWILRDGGLNKFLSELSNYVSKNYIQRNLLKLKYGKAAPSPETVIYVDPKKINHGYPSKHTPDIPEFGVLSGDWDLEKSNLNDSWVTVGLKERFDEKKDWDKTKYYSVGIKKINNGEKLTTINNNGQSEAGLESYFQSLDQLYHSMKNEGFKSEDELKFSDLPKIHIGRDGELILTKGHHRTVMAQSLGINTMPTRVGLRHSSWQDVRIKSIKNKECMQSNSLHPDIKSLRKDLSR